MRPCARRLRSHRAGGRSGWQQKPVAGHADLQGCHDLRDDRRRRYGYQTGGPSRKRALSIRALAYNIYRSRVPTRAKSLRFNNNGLSQSSIGLKIEENIGAGFVASADRDGLRSDVWRLGRCLQKLGRSQRCNALGVMRNHSPTLRRRQPMRPGLSTVKSMPATSSATFGTLTIGRQNSLPAQRRSHLRPEGTVPTPCRCSAVRAARARAPAAPRWPAGTTR